MKRTCRRLAREETVTGSLQPNGNQVRLLQDGPATCRHGLARLSQISVDNL